MDFQSRYFTVSIDDRQVATITLTRADKHNAFNDSFIKDMTQLLQLISTDNTIRIVVLQASGQHFCAGADIQWMQKAAQYSEAENHQDSRKLALMMKHLYELPQPLISLIQGAVYGGGIGLVACSDIAIATENAHFCFSEVRIGLTPSVISPYILNAIGQRHARRYFLTAEKISAEKALAIDLIHQVVYANALISTGDRIIEQLLKNSPNALTQCKLLLNKANEPFINDDFYEFTLSHIATVRASNEGQEGLNAFLQKRDPSWIVNKS